VLRNVHISDYIQLALTSDHLRALFHVENGAMSVENFYSDHSGTTAYYFITINSALLLSNITAVRNYVGGYLLIGHVFGQLRIQSAVFGDFNISESDSVKAIDGTFRAPVFVAWTSAEVQLRDVKFVDQVYWRYAVLFVASYSKFTIQNVWMKDLVLEVITLTASQGQITNLVVETCRIRLFLVQLFGVSNLILRNSYASFKTMGWGETLDGMFVVAAHSQLDSYDMVLQNSSSKALVYAKRGTFRCWNLTIQGGKLNSLVGSAIDSSISLYSLKVLECRTAIAQAFQSHIFIVDSQFIAVSGVDKLVVLYNSTIHFQRTLFSNITSDSVFGKLRQRSTLIMDQCTWVHVGTKIQGTNWLLTDGVAVIRDCHFAFISSSLLQARLSDVSLARSTFRNIANLIMSTKSEQAYGGVVGCIDCHSLRVEDVYMFNASSAVGGALSMIAHDIAGRLYVRNSTFVLCTATYMGGVLYIKDVSLEIVASGFRLNSAGSAG